MPNHTKYVENVLQQQIGNGGRLICAEKRLRRNAACEIHGRETSNTFERAWLKSDVGTLESRRKDTALAESRHTELQG